MRGLMADRKSRGAGQARRARQLPQHIGAGVLRVLLLAVREASEHDAAHLSEDACKREMRPHAIQPIGSLTDVLEQQNGALEMCEKGRPEKPRQHREIPPDERSFGHTADVSLYGAELCGWSIGLEQAKETVMRR